MNPASPVSVPAGDGRAARRRGWASAALLLLPYLALVLPLILSGHDRGRGAYDQNVFHLVSIRAFLRQFPHFDFSDYPSATTPGFQVVVAIVGHFVSDDLRTLRLAGSVFSIGLVATLAAMVGRRVGVAAAVTLCLPVVCCLYVVSSGAWLLPDNAGWWALLGVMAVALRPRVDRWTYLLGGAAFLAVVLVRQSHAWALAPLCVAAWLGGEQEPAPTPADLPPLPLRTRLGQLVAMGMATLPGLLSLGYFLHLWHGTVPPNQRVWVGGGNPAAPAMALAVAGTLGVSYTPLVWPRLRDRRSTVAAVAAVGAAVGLVIGAVPATTYDVDKGRFSGIWNAVPYFPYVAHRSPLMIALAVLGGAVLGVWLLSLPVRQRWVWLSAIAGFLAAQAAGHYAAQRYIEPFVLIAAALSLSTTPDRPPRSAFIGPLLLSVLLLAITLLSLR